ncbi:MAG: type III-B CRISPR module RAMP protein Cmr1 [Bacteroidales bacterium]|nr:type III-B CRISPR module RAMP protein Cmr1 [Bacteroidales bacterium]
MPREIPAIPKGWQPPRPEPGRSYEIELITPMFGGGVVARTNDPSFPIRPTSIRGQLQFWWRATVGAQYATRQELRTAQSAIWGDTTQASRVQVRVEVLKVDPPVACAQFEPDYKDPSRNRTMPTWNALFKDSKLPYALFPFQGQLTKDRKRIETPPASYIRNATFRLTLTFHKSINFAKQVEPALWAWVNFGGLGGRTRRGCGAIRCQALAPHDADDLQATWVRHMPKLFPQREWPTLAENILLRTSTPLGDPIRVWDWLIGCFRHFRQGEGLGRNPRQQSNRPGRSRYPEPEAIRRVTRARLPKHARLSQIPEDAFPRAELGLPIVFHFQEQGEPPDTVLYPDNDAKGNKRERMASPLILKPLALQNGQAMPLILQLQTPTLTGVDLRRGNTSLALPPTTVIRDPRLANYQYSPLVESPCGSAIEAFLALARSEGFQEVPR